MLLEHMLKYISLDELKFPAANTKVFIFIANLTSWNENILEFWECLSNQEKEQANKYASEQLVNKYIISHGILRSILGYYADIKPKNIEFTYNKYGKPFLKGDNSIQFNMAHSKNFVVYIIASEHQVGIDIEFQDDNIDVDSMADLVLTSSEYKLLNEMEEDIKIQSFYNIWTKKEALIKANGRGLSYLINTIEVMTLDSDGGTYLLRNKYEIEKKWYCFLIKELEYYSGAVAIEHKINEVTYVNISKNATTIKTQCFH